LQPQLKSHFKKERCADILGILLPKCREYFAEFYDWASFYVRNATCDGATSGHSHAKSDTQRRRRPSILGQRIIVAKVRRFSGNGCGKPTTFLLIVSGFRAPSDINDEEGKRSIACSTRWFMGRLSTDWPVSES